jgi:hypothetical protein
MEMLLGCKTSSGITDAPSEPEAQPSSSVQMPAGRLNEVSYSYQGMMMNVVGQPTLKRTEGGKALLSFHYYSEERSYEVSDTLLDKAREIIEEEKMYEYAPSYSLNLTERILDGYSWSFDAVFEGGKRLSSHGRHVSPNGDGLNRIERLLETAARECLPEE